MDTLYEAYLDEKREFATRVRLTEQVNKDSNEMDCSPLEGDSDEGPNAPWYNWKDEWAITDMGSDVDALGKGKGGKKGQKGKGKGTNGWGYQGKALGSSSASSGGQGFTGKFNYCGMTGHKAA